MLCSNDSYQLYCNVQKNHSSEGNDIHLALSCVNRQILTSIHRSLPSRPTGRHLQIRLQEQLPRARRGDWVLVVTSHQHTWHLDWHEESQADPHTEASDTRGKHGERARGRWSGGRHDGRRFCAETGQGVRPGASYYGELRWADGGGRGQYVNARLGIFRRHNGEGGSGRGLVCYWL